MKKNPLAKSLLALALAASALRASALSIVTTTSDLASLARSVAGEHADVRSICTGVEDPHFLAAKPSFIAAARAADLWIAIGLELEAAWEKPILEGSRNARIRPGTPGYLDVSEHVRLLDVPQGPITRAMGDVHPGGNPHYWLDPWNGRQIAAAIAKRLELLDPAHGEAYRANLAAFQRSLDVQMFGSNRLKSAEAEALWARWPEETPPDIGTEGAWVDRMAGWRGQGLVTYHKSWVYFCRRFGLKVVAELEPKPGVPPSASHLAGIMRLVESSGTRLILQEPFYSRKAADAVAAKTGARVVVSANSVGGEPLAVDYLALMDLIIQRVGSFP